MTLYPIFICDAFYSTLTGSPMTGSFKGHWFVSQATKRRSSQNFTMDIIPYCNQNTPKIPPRGFRTGIQSACIYNDSGLNPNWV